MKLIRKYALNGGINKHTIWVYEENKRQVEINQNHDVGGSQFYIFDETNVAGEGCNTIWYPSLEVAQKEVERLFKTGETEKTGVASKLCSKCQNHYSPYTPKGHPSKRWGKTKPNICDEFKVAHSLLFSLRV